MSPTTVSVTVNPPFERYPAHGYIGWSDCGNSTVSTLTVRQTLLKVLTCSFRPFNPLPPTGVTPAAHAQGHPVGSGDRRAARR